VYVRKCANKLGEELIETIDAVKDGDREEVIHEAADVILRLLNVLGARGISLEQVMPVLKKRVDSYTTKNHLEDSAGS
jgi:phosphoribosyl-ATP pyrophosphohydrolase